MKQLIHNAWVLTFDENWQEFTKGYVYLEDGKIIDVGENNEKLEAYQRIADKIVDAKGRWLMPGLINGHTHLFQTFMRGLDDNKRLRQWLFEEIYPICNVMEEEDMYLSSLLGCIENLKNGATTVLDQNYIHTSKKNSDNVLRAMEETGIRGVYCRTFADKLPLPSQKPLVESSQVIFEELNRLKSIWHGKDDGRLQLALGPSSPWGSTPELISSSYAYAEENDLMYQIHTAENERVVQDSLDAYGMRNIPFLHSIGALGKKSQLAHAVDLEEDEILLVQKTGAMIVHNPVSNMYLASGVAPVPRYRELGIPVALGTDGPGSNNNQDMIEVLKTTTLLHRIHTKDAAIISPQNIIRMATYEGGQVILNRNDVGMLKVGFKGDMLLVNWKRAHIAPVHSAISGLIFNANGNDVDCVWVDGKMVVEEKKICNIDESSLIEACQDRALYLRKRAKGLQ